MNLRLRNVPTQ